MNSILYSLPSEWSEKAKSNFTRARNKRTQQEMEWDDVPDEGTRWIPLLNGTCATVDEDNYDFLMQWNWSLNNWGYAVRRIKGKSVSMHRVISECPHGMEVDHINHQTLDNRRCNLRICTTQENQFNRTKQDGFTSNFKGVSYSRHRRKWMAFARIDYKTVNLGGYNTEIEAARAYDLWAQKNQGQFANPNLK